MCLISEVSYLDVRNLDGCLNWLCIDCLMCLYLGGFGIDWFILDGWWGLLDALALLLGVW